MLVINEHGLWRRVRLHDGEEGWIHKALLTSRRTAILPRDAGALTERPAENAPTVATVAAITPLRVLACGADWCRLERDGVRGWAPKRLLWGVGAKEVF